MFAITVFTWISATVLVRHLFEYFHKVIKIHCNRCNAVLASNGNLFLAIVMLFLKCVYLDALSFRSLFKIFAFFSSCVKVVNFASTTSPTSLFLFPATVAVRRLSAFACKETVNINAIARSVHGQQEYFQHLVVHVSRTRRLRWCRILWLWPFYLPSQCVACVAGAGKKWA